MGSARWWVCDSCKSLNDVPANKCYHCRAGKPSDPTLFDDTYSQVGSHHRVGISVDRSRVRDLARPDPVETKKSSGIDEAFRQRVKGGGELSTAPGQTLRVTSAQASGGTPGSPSPRDEGLEQPLGTGVGETTAPAPRPLREPTPRSIADVGSRPWSDAPGTGSGQPLGMTGSATAPGAGETPSPGRYPPPPAPPAQNATPPPRYAVPPGHVPPPGYVPPPGSVPPPGYVPPPGSVPPPGYAPPPGSVPPPGYVPPTGLPARFNPPPPPPGYPRPAPMPGSAPPWPPGPPPTTGYGPPPPPAPPGPSEPPGPPAGEPSPPPAPRDESGDE